MGFWQVVTRFLPQPWKGVRVRKQIKATHLENIRRLENEQTVKCDFDKLDESLLGEFASKKHFQTKSRIKSVGSRKEAGFSVYNRSDREAIKGLSRSTIRRIRVKNVISIVFWIAFVFIIILLLGFAVSFPTNLI